MDHKKNGVQSNIRNVSFTKREMNNRRWEKINWLLEIGAKSEMSEFKRKRIH